MLFRLLTFPSTSHGLFSLSYSQPDDAGAAVPIIAAVNGHSFAGGMVLAMACDYRVMTDGSKRNAWMCMNEVCPISFLHSEFKLISAQIHFGPALPVAFTALTRSKFPDGRLGRRIFLEGHRFTPTEALEAGLVDHIVGGDTEAVLTKAIELAASIEHLPQFGSYGVIKVCLAVSVSVSIS